VISNLQILRGLAALGVVFYHTDFRLPGDWHTEFFGVSTFFVISGFIMCFITRDPEGGDATARGFMMRRLIRIVPAYWLCTIAAIILVWGAPLAFWHFIAWTQTTIVTPAWLMRSFFFLPPQPEGTMPLLGVGWTLNFEIYFYAVFTLALLINRRIAPLIAWAIVYAVINANAYADNWLIRFYSHGYIHYFLYGIALFYVWSFTKDHLPKWPTVIACAAIVVICYGSQFVTPLLQAANPSFSFYENYCPVLLVAAALFSASAGADITWRPLVLLGDASYAIYLSHTITMQEIRRQASILSPWKESIAVTLLVVVICTLIGIAVHLWIEKPMLRRIRSIKFRASKRAEPEPAVITSGG
jgi:exopolysaccharide production protein ExoZ